MPDAVVTTQETSEIAVYDGGSNGALGQILINPDAIARIAGMAASEIADVRLGARGTLADRLVSALPGQEPVRGISVIRTDSGRYSIVAEVKMAYRTPMRETAEKLQRHIKETVERMTGLELEAVNVKIADIYLDKDREKEASE